MIKQFFKEFIVIFIVVFVSNAIVVYLWNFISYGKGAFDWGLTLGLAITIGIAVALATFRKT